MSGEGGTYFGLLFLPPPPFWCKSARDVADSCDFLAVPAFCGGSVPGTNSASFDVGDGAVVDVVASVRAALALCRDAGGWAARIAPLRVLRGGVDLRLVFGMVAG